MRICIIDDNKDVLEAMAFILRDEGHDIAMAGNGPDGLAILESADCDAVVVDLNLPGMRGDAVAAEVRSRHADVVIVLVSGQPNPLPALLGEHGLVDAFIQKPFLPKALVAVLKGAQKERRCAE